MDKRLYRSRIDKQWGGVCAGLGKYFTTDPTWFRIAFILLTLAGGGGGLVLYLIAWIIVPEEPVTA